MKISENISSALLGITGNKMRALLTMFGIIMGIGSVIMITSIGNGYKQSITQQFEATGMDVMRMSAYSEDENETIDEWDYLTHDDVEALKRYDGLTVVSALNTFFVSGMIETVDPNKLTGAYIHGVDSQYFHAVPLKLASGRHFVEQEVNNHANVVIIDEDLARNVFGRTDVIGKRLELRDGRLSLSYSIIGVIQSDDETRMYAMYDMSKIYLPLTTLQSTIYDSGYVDTILMKAANLTDLKRIGQNAVRIVEFQHGNHNKYTVRFASDELEQANMVINMFTLFLGFVAGISLLVGGIGVMNIMLVSVTERTSEIGIRKSLGATNGNIQLQFLVEAVILTSIGGGLGLLFGYAGGMGLGAAAGMLTGEAITPALTWQTMLLAGSISAIIRIVFGVYPAGRAARLDPIEALRFEG